MMLILCHEGVIGLDKAKARRLSIGPIRGAILGNITYHIPYYAKDDNKATLVLKPYLLS